MAVVHSNNFTFSFTHLLSVYLWNFVFLFLKGINGRIYNVDCTCLIEGFWLSFRRRLGVEDVKLLEERQKENEEDEVVDEGSNVGLLPHD